MFDHTADLGIECSGRTMKELLENAAAVMLDCMFERDGLEAIEEHALSAAGDDREELLINFLREILYRVNGERFLPKEIAITSLEGARLTCRLAGEHYDGDRHRWKGEIKAVTYHNVSIEEGPAGLTARVVLDV